MTDEAAVLFSQVFYSEIFKKGEKTFVCNAFETALTALQDKYADDAKRFICLKRVNKKGAHFCGPINPKFEDGVMVPVNVTPNVAQRLTYQETLIGRNPDIQALIELLVDKNYIV